MPADTSTPATKGFNPRTREGCDVSHGKCQRPGIVSIHAPVRGATGFFAIPDVDDLFQSTHP